MNGMSRGVSWLNTMSYKLHGTYIYCQPSKMIMNTGNFVSIIDKEIELQKESNENYADVEVGLLLVYGLVRTFPCDKK